MRTLCSTGETVIDLNALYWLVQIVEQGGYSAASRALGIPKSTLSRHITKLEEHLGVRLIQRSTRHFALTEIGQEYYQQCVAMLAAVDAAQAVVERQQTIPRGIIRLSCPTALLDFIVSSMISRYMQRYPQVEIQIESTNRHVDVLREGLDLALRVDFPPLEDSSLVMKVLSKSPQELIASPYLLERLGQVQSPAELTRFPSLEGGCAKAVYEWCLETPNQATEHIRHYPRLVTDNLITIRRAALDAAGIAQLPLLVVFKDLMQGSLVPVLPAWKPREGIVYAVFPSRRGLLSSVRSLLDFLGQCFAELDFTDLYASYVKRGDEDACFLTGPSRS